MSTRPINPEAFLGDPRFKLSAEVCRCVIKSLAAGLPHDDVITVLANVTAAVVADRENGAMPTVPA